MNPEKHRHAHTQIKVNNNTKRPKNPPSPWTVNASSHKLAQDFSVTGKYKTKKYPCKMKYSV